MITYTIYSTETGRILENVTGPQNSVENTVTNAGTEAAAVIGHYSAEEFYIVNGKATKRPDVTLSLNEIGLLDIGELVSKVRIKGDMHDWTGEVSGTMSFDIYDEVEVFVTPAWPAKETSGVFSVSRQSGGDTPVPKAAKKVNDAINLERTRRITFGTDFTVSGYNLPVALTGRDVDKSVYLGLLIEAKSYIDNSITTEMLIRDRNDVNHSLTPEQVVELVQKSLQWFKQIMTISWHMKDETGVFAAGLPDDWRNDEHWKV